MSDSIRDDLDEQDLAQQTLRSLQAKGDQTFELGQLLRGAASHEQPESNSELRELLQTQAYDEVKTVAAAGEASVASTPRSRAGSSSRLWRLSAVAASLLCCFGLSYFLFGDKVYMAEHIPGSIPEPLLAKPDVVFNSQLAGGTSENLKIEVAENGSQSPQFAVPYYTADGKMFEKRGHDKFSVDLGWADEGKIPNRSIVIIEDNGFAAGKNIRFEAEGRKSQIKPQEAIQGQRFWRSSELGEITEAYGWDKEKAIGYFEGDGEGKGRSSGEQYNPILENRFTPTSGLSAVSTFSIDVDTASYSNMRRFLSEHQRPPLDSIRIEELVNYFSYDYPQPKGEDPFSVNMEIAGCPWNEAHQLLRVGLQGKQIHVQERPATNVVYLIDVSGSMQNADKLPLLKSGFQMLSRQLGENDRVSIVTYAGNAGVVLEPTSGEQTKTINQAIERLSAGGSTHGSAGIELAYELAQQNFIEDGVNKVMLATDGDLNVGVTRDGALVELIKQKASEGVFLTVLGFGTGNLKDGKLEQLADNGNGHYAYIDNTREAHRVLVEQLSGSLVTIAKDVKIQVEFNPAEVKSYRLIGYENRALATKDFDDDGKDAGEIGAGHSVTAIYEIQPAGVEGAALSVPGGMKYQQASPEEAPPVEARLSDVAQSGELATLALRYKQPDANESKRIEFVVKNEDRSFPSASDDFRFAASVAGFGMWLRNSEYLGDANLEMLLEMASGSVGDDASGYRSEFVDLIRKAISIRQ